MLQEASVYPSVIDSKKEHRFNTEEFKKYPVIELDKKEPLENTIMPYGLEKHFSFSQ